MTPWFFFRVKGGLALLFFSLLLAAGEPCRAAGIRLEFFFEAMDGQGWQQFFIADSVRKRVGGPEMKVYPLVTRNAAGKFEARRGETELAESMRLAVLGQAYPGKILTYLNARSLSPWSDGWRDALIFCGLDPDEFSKKSSAEGPDALKAAYDRAQAAGVQSSSLLINGKPYTGAQRVLPLLEAVNAALPAEKRAALPKSYTDRPKLPPPQIWVVLSSSPFSQKNDALLGVFEKYFEGAKPRFLDYDSPERASRFPGLDFTPAYAVEASTAARERLDAEIKAGIFREAGGWLVYYDRQRKGFFPGRERKENTLELFVMSQCPFGTQAEDALFEAQKSGTLPAGLKLEIHYIGDTVIKEDGSYEFSSLHGQPEWEEDLRQLVIARDFPAKLQAYLLARNKAVNSTDWQTPASSAGIDPQKVSAAFEAAKKLLADDFAATGALGISTSPSLVWEGRAYMVGLAELTKLPGFEKVVLPGSSGAACNNK